MSNDLSVNSIISGILFLSLLFIPSISHALEVGDVSPDFHFITLDGKEVSYEKDIKGKKPIYLMFWATW